jgi:hypothetical protein
MHSINIYISVPGNSLLLSEPPRGAYNWTSKAGAAAAAADVDLQDYEEDAAYLDSEGPESLAWEDRYQDGGDDYWRMGTGDGVFFFFRFSSLFLFFSIHSFMRGVEFLWGEVRRSQSRWFGCRKTANP